MSRQTIHIEYVGDNVLSAKQVKEALIKHCKNVYIKSIEANVESTEDILVRKISTIDSFSIRTINCLRSLEIFTVESLIKHSMKDLYRARGFGRKCFREVELFVVGHKLSLSKDHKFAFRIHND